MHTDMLLNDGGAHRFWSAPQRSAMMGPPFCLS